MKHYFRRLSAEGKACRVPMGYCHVIDDYKISLRIRSPRGKVLRNRIKMAELQDLLIYAVENFYRVKGINLKPQEAQK